MVSFQKRPLTFISRPLKSAIQLQFLRRLSRSLANGYTLVAALETLKWDKQLYELTNEVISQLKTGTSFDQVLDNLSFHPIITTYLHFAKEYEDLGSSIRKCVEIYEQRLQHTKKLSQVMRYPVILIVFFTITFFFIQHTVLPNLLSLFEQHTQQSHTFSIAIVISSIVYYSFISLIIITLLIHWIWRAVKKSVPIRLQLKIYQLLPFYRRYMRLNTSYLFSTHIGSLLKTGLSIKDILSIISKQDKLPILAHYTSVIMKELNKGHHVSEVMDHFYFIHPQLTAIFQKNINAQHLEKDLTTYAAFLMDELNQRIVRLLSFIQPIFFIILGSIIILIYLSLMLPMYQFIETI